MVNVDVQSLNIFAGFHSSSTGQATVPSIDATAENFNMKLNLGICTGMHHTIGIGRGRGFGRGQH